MNRRYIDFHAHVFPDALAQKATAAIGRFYGIDMAGGGSLQALLQSADALGWQGTYIVHSAATTARQVHSINDFIAAIAADRADCIGFGTLHPDLEDLPAEVARIGELGLRGIKLHPDFQTFAIDSPKSIAMLRLLPRGTCVITHAGDTRYAYDTPRQIANAVQACPHLTFIAAHLGGYSQWQEAEEYLRDLPVYYDTSSALFALEGARAADIIRAHGVEKTLWGSDFPMWDHVGEMQRFLALPLTDAEKTAILYDNGAALLGLGR